MIIFNGFPLSQLTDNPSWWALFPSGWNLFVFYNIVYKSQLNLEQNLDFLRFTQKAGHIFVYFAHFYFPFIFSSGNYIFAGIARHSDLLFFSSFILPLLTFIKFFTKIIL